MRSKAIPNILILASGLLIIACTEVQPKLLLPVFGEKKIVSNDTLYHTIQNFQLINQYNEEISKQTVAGKLYVANFFFVSCQSICPEMSSNLKDVQAAFENDGSLLILSHSINPIHDSVAVLSQYAQVYGAKKNKWHLLTGIKKEIYELAKTSYLVNAIEDDGSAEGFLHSELFLLIDTQGRIRGMYDGTNKVEVQKLISDTRLLKKEHY